MGGTRSGGLLAYETILERYGQTADGKSVLHVRAGIKGGRNGHTGGFYGNKAAARIAGAKGGAASKPYSVKQRPAHWKGKQA